MAKYEVEFDSDGKITVKDPEFIRRLRLILQHDRRLTVSLAPDDPRAIDMMNVKCPPIPLPNVGCVERVLARCPDPVDWQCPMLFRNPIETVIRNEWAFGAAWKAAGDRAVSDGREDRG